MHPTETTPAPAMPVRPDAGLPSRRLERIAAALVRRAHDRPVLAVTLVSLLAGALWAATSLGQVPDATLFTDAGRTLFSGSWADVFADSYLQIGPVYLVLTGLVVLVADLFHVSPELLVAAVGSAVIGAATVLVTRTALLLRARASSTAELGAGLTVALASPLCVTAWSGHFEEIITALLLLAAVNAAGRGRPLVCGLLIGLAAGTKMWGLLGIGILLVDSTSASLFSFARVRRVLVGVAATAGVLALTHLPFLAFGTFATFDKSWGIGYPAPLALVLDDSAFTFTGRAVQGLAAVATGAVFALLGRRDVRTLWTVPAAVICVRLLLDPFLQSYYVAPVMVCVAVGVWSMAVDGARYRRALVVSAAMPVAWLVLALVGGPVGAAFAGVGLVVLVAFLARLRFDAGRAVSHTLESAG